VNEITVNEGIIQDEQDDFKLNVRIIYQWCKFCFTLVVFGLT